jgi:hypothetical protein
MKDDCLFIHHSSFIGRERSSGFEGAGTNPAATAYSSAVCTRPASRDAEECWPRAPAACGNEAHADGEGLPRGLAADESAARALGESGPRSVAAGGNVVRVRACTARAACSGARCTVVAADYASNSAAVCSACACARSLFARSSSRASCHRRANAAAPTPVCSARATARR